MLDIDTFLTTVYVMVDDFCKQHPAEPTGRPGPAPSLTASEVITLGIFAQWGMFATERAFYRMAQRRLRPAFPRLPNRSQFNRLLRQQADQIGRLGHWLASQLDALTCAYETLDGFGVATRNAQRRTGGWLPGIANIGRCSRLGWYEGLHVLTATTPTGAITGWGLAPASTKDQPFAETFLAARHTPHPRLPEVGAPARGSYVTDNGFMGHDLQQHWADDYGAHLVTPPHPNGKVHWPPALQTYIAGLRQIVETVHEKLLHTFRLDRERPHDLTGVRTRMAAVVALHTTCMWINQRLGRDLLAFGDLVDW
jgi:hypothetical protein